MLLIQKKWNTLSRQTIAFLSVCLTIVPSMVNGQAACALVPASPQANCTNCIPVTGNTNINPGEVYCFNGTDLSVGSVNMSDGGTLLICNGTLTVGSLAFNGGNIVINAGATLNIGANAVSDALVVAQRGITNYGTMTINNNSFTLNSNQSFVNFGTFTYLSAELNLNGANAVLQNNGSGVMNLRSVNLNSNSRLVNAGDLNIAENLRINNGASICLLKCAITGTRSLFNQQANSVVVGTAPARPCISFSDRAEMNAPLSGTNRLIVCKAATAQVSGGASVPFGDAQVIENCASCQPTQDACDILLPLTFQSFEVKKINTLVQAAWSMVADISITKCSLEGSRDGIAFTTLKTWNSNQTTYDVRMSSNDYCLFRIKAITSSGSIHYSPIKSIECTDWQESFFAWAQPASNNPLIQMRFLQQTEGQATIGIADAQGRNLYSGQVPVPKGVYTHRLDLQALGKNLTRGVYFVTVQFKDGRHYSQKLVW